MSSIIPLPSNIVIDASLLIKAILPVEQKTIILELLSDWHKSRHKLLAPEILLPEAVSAIRRCVFNREINETEAWLAVEDIFGLGIEVINSDERLCKLALTWASRLEQSKAYDGFYLALAEMTAAELWTADEKLVNRTRQLGINWVRSFSHH